MSTAEPITPEAVHKQLGSIKTSLAYMETDLAKIAPMWGQMEPEAIGLDGGLASLSKLLAKMSRLGGQAMMLAETLHEGCHHAPRRARNACREDLEAPTSPCVPSRGSS